MSVKINGSIIQNQIWAISLFVIAYSLKPFSNAKWLEVVSSCECAQSIDVSILSGNYHSILDIIYGAAFFGFIAGLFCTKGHRVWAKIAVSVLWVFLFVAVNPLFR